MSRKTCVYNMCNISCITYITCLYNVMYNICGHSNMYDHKCVCVCACACACAYMPPPLGIISNHQSLKLNGAFLGPEHPSSPQQGTMIHGPSSLLLHAVPNDLLRWILSLLEWITFS